MSLLLPKSYVHRNIMVRENRAKAAAQVMKRRITALIQKHYPEHLFTVEVNPDNGNILLDHPLLIHAKARYFCRFADFNDGRGVLKLCGEILERVNVRRGELKHFEDYDVAEPLAKTQFSAR